MNTGYITNVCNGYATSGNLSIDYSGLSTTDVGIWSYGYQTYPQYPIQVQLPQKGVDTMKKKVFIRSDDLERVQQKKLVEVSFKESKEFDCDFTVEVSRILDDGHGRRFVFGY